MLSPDEDTCLRWCLLCFKIKPGHLLFNTHPSNRHSSSTGLHTSGRGLHCTSSHTRSHPRWCLLEADRSHRSIPFHTGPQQRCDPRPLGCIFQCTWLQTLWRGGGAQGSILLLEPLPYHFWYPSSWIHLVGVLSLDLPRYFGRRRRSLSLTHCPVQETPDPDTLVNMCYHANIFHFWWEIFCHF